MRHHAGGYQVTARSWKPLSQPDITISHTRIHLKSSCSIMKGYKKLAALMGPFSEDVIFRGFGSLNMLSLLFMQAELKFIDIYLDDSASDIETVKHFCRNFVKLRASKGTYDDHYLQILENIEVKLAECGNSI